MNAPINKAWQIYTKAWSETNETKRHELLRQCLASSAKYSDPHVTATGIEAISDYMDQFQKQIPGGYFKIQQQAEHNQQLLTQWQIINANDEVIMNGSSFGEYDEKGYLQKMTGFF